MLAFRSSARLATAYGVSVTGALVVDTVLLLVVARVLWHWRRWQLALAARRLRRRGADLPGRQPVEGRARRLAAAAHRRRRLHAS